MNHLELTREQKVKLLKMCNILFPEFGWLLPGSSLYGTKSEEGFPSIIIHWFEFCMINLFHAILREGYINAPAFYTIVLTKMKHPVDYLYEEFEKLTPNINEQQGSNSKEEVY